MTLFIGPGLEADSFGRVWVKGSQVWSNFGRSNADTSVSIGTSVPLPHYIPEGIRAYPARSGGLDHDLQVSQPSRVSALDSLTASA